MDHDERARALHEALRGKISITPKRTIESRDDLSLVYTPGVGCISRDIAKDVTLANVYTTKGSMVAIVSDGSAVLGLGDIGPTAALPVMEGKSVLFKRFADVDAVPLCLDVHTADQLIAHIRALEPTFGGINLEDIKAPICFEVERALQDIGIPVFHDDQHGTAIVAYAGLLNALKVMNRLDQPQRIVINGAGAAGHAIATMIAEHAGKDADAIRVENIIVCDSRGALYKGRESMTVYKNELAEITNIDTISGSLGEVIRDATIFIGVSVGGMLTTDMVQTMSSEPIIFALANPDPEIMPDEAHAGGAGIVATGRSDFPNQVNNVVAFPGIFKAAFTYGYKQITDDMKYCAALGLARLIDEPTPTNILPDIFEHDTAAAIVDALDPKSLH